MVAMFTQDRIDAEVAATRALKTGQARDVFGVQVVCYKRGWFDVRGHKGLKALNAVMLIVNMPSLRAAS